MCAVENNFDVGVLVLVIQGKSDVSVYGVF
jgi:hypothetical protein